MSLREAAAAIGVHHTTLGRAVRQGLLAPAKRTPGGYPRFAPEAVETYAASLTGLDDANPNQRNRYRRLRNAMLLLSSELRPETVLQRLVEEARVLVGARYGALGVMDDGGAIRSFYTVGLTPDHRAGLGDLPEGKGLLGELFKGGRPIRVANIADHPRSVGFPSGHPPMRSLLGVPIVTQGRNIGNIYLTDKVTGDEFTAEDQALVEELARYAAIAIRNADMYQRSERRSQQWAAMQNIANRITLAMQRNQVLRQVVVDAQHLLQVDAAFIALLDQKTGRLRTVVSRGLPPRTPASPTTPVTTGAGNQAIWGGRPLIIDDYANDARFSDALKEHTANRLGLVSLIVAPLEARGNPLGALYLGMRRRRTFLREEADLVGQLASLAAVVLDNARQFEAEREAHQRAERAEARLHMIVEHEPEAVVVISPNRRVTTANTAASRLFFGRDDQRLAGRSYPFGATFLTPEGKRLPADEWPIARCLAGEGPCLGVELVLQRPDNTRIPVLVNAVLIPPSPSDPGGAVAVLQDISRLKEVEQLKNDFMAMISHDLKSPLTTIKGLASSVLLNAEGEHATIPVDWARVIEAEVDRLTELVDNLLDMSRIESGAMPLDVEECYMEDLAPDCVWRVAQGEEAIADRISVEVAPNLPPVMADYLQVQRVVCNLLSNAVKYSPAGTPIHLRAHAGEHGDTLVVEVQDHGSGIPAAELDMVFEKFYRSSHNARGGRSGSGLGLAICRAIMFAHGGTISVASEVGEGSTFRFELPFQPDDKELAPTHANS